MYKLLPSKLFDNDIDSVYQYIRENLEAPMAAENLMAELKIKLTSHNKRYTLPAGQARLQGFRSASVL
jgi:hypothetical protein